MKFSRLFVMPLLLLLGMARVFAADITGTWKASFETQIGQQNYTYQFVVKGTTLTGKIQSDMGGTSEVLQGKVTRRQVQATRRRLPDTSPVADFEARTGPADLDYPWRTRG